MSPSTPIGDALHAVLRGEAHASSPKVRRLAGGEWDAWYALPPRSRKRLIGAGYARSGGMPPDELADLIARERGLDDFNDALAWFYRNALAAIPEGRSARQAGSRQALARGFGLPSYYAYRTIICQEAGYRSLWHYRQEQGWAENRSPQWRPRLHLDTTFAYGPTNGILTV